MNKLLTLFTVALSFLLAAPHAPAENAAQMAKRIVDLTNQYRASKDLPPLQASAAAASQAMAHSIAMSRDEVPIGHDGFDARLEKIRGSTKFTHAGENVGYLKIRKGDIARRAVDMWIKSPGHNKNLLGDFNQIGVGIATNNEGATYLTQIFLNSTDAPAANAPARRSSSQGGRLSTRNSDVQVRQIRTP